MRISSYRRFSLRAALGMGAFSAALLCGGTAFASDGTITINGTIKATTCAVTAQLGTTIPTTGSTPNLTVTLPTISWQSISAPNAWSGNTPFSIGVYGCGTSANTMTVNFDTANTNMSAAGVLTTTGLVGKYMRLLNADQTTAVVPGTPLAGTPISSGGAGQTFYAQWYNGTGATLTSSNVGNASASLVYTVNYT